MLECDLCGREVDEQPKITEDGQCSECGADLTIVSKGGKKRKTKMRIEISLIGWEFVFYWRKSQPELRSS